MKSILVKEFADYGILIYPVYDLKDDILSSFPSSSHQLANLKKFSTLQKNGLIG